MRIPTTGVSRAQQKIRVLIAAADTMSGELMAGALKRCRNSFEVVAVASNSPEALRKLEMHKPQVAVVSADLQDGPQTGFSVLQKLRESHPETAAVMLLHSPKRTPVIDAFRGGARGVISCHNSFKDLSKCIRSVHAGRVWASNQELEFILDTLTYLKPVQLFQLREQNGMGQLTLREQEVVRLVAVGMKNREIAEMLRITEHTVSNYVYRIFEKLGVSTRVELVFHTFDHAASGTPANDEMSEPAARWDRKALNAHRPASRPRVPLASLRKTPQRASRRERVVNDSTRAPL
jgi:two-component system, NarL family, nitrate/nitrite response regulator NarL